MTSKLGHGDIFSSKWKVISRCMLYEFKTFLGQLEVKLLRKKAISSNIFDPGDLKTRSWWPISKSVIDLVQMHVFCDFQLPRSKSTKAIMLLAVLGWLTDCLTDCLTTWPHDINALKPSIKLRNMFWYMHICCVTLLNHRPVWTGINVLYSVLLIVDYITDLDIITMLNLLKKPQIVTCMSSQWYSFDRLSTPCG